MSVIFSRLWGYNSENYPISSSEEEGGYSRRSGVSCFDNIISMKFNDSSNQHPQSLRDSSLKEESFFFEQNIPKSSSLRKREPKAEEGVGC
jgi:hypothetical protein